MFLPRSLIEYMNDKMNRESLVTKKKHHHTLGISGASLMPFGAANYDHFAKL